MTFLCFFSIFSRQEPKVCCKFAFFLSFENFKPAEASKAAISWSLSKSSALASSAQQQHKDVPLSVQK
jgi:hypothetical protein